MKNLGDEYNNRLDNQKRLYILRNWKVVCRKYLNQSIQTHMHAYTRTHTSKEGKIKEIYPQGEYIKNI
jgi:hypothetical protein